LEDPLSLLRTLTSCKKVLYRIYIVSSKYPGRASGSPIVDLFITLLAMGKKSIKELKI
jgi:hypothetical protein